MIFRKPFRPGHNHGTHSLTPGNVAVVINLHPLQRPFQAAEVRQTIEQPHLAGTFRQASFQCLPCIVGCMIHRLAPTATLGHGNRDFPARLQAQGFCQQVQLIRGLVQQHIFWRRAAFIELAQEPGQNQARFHLFVVAWKIRPRAIILARPVKENLDTALPPAMFQGNHIRVANAFNIDILAGLDMGHGAQPIPIRSGAFKVHGIRRGLHLTDQIILHLLRSTRQERFGLRHGGGIAFLRDIADTGRAAAFDLVLQAGARPIAKHPIRAIAQQKGALQHIQGTIDRPCRGEWTKEIPFPVPCAPVLNDLGKVLIAPNQDVWKCLIIPQQHIIARHQALDQIVFQQQRLNLAGAGHKFHRCGFRNHALQADRQSIWPGIGRNALAQVMCLANI